MKTQRAALLFLSFGLTLLAVPRVQAHLFTDDQGRQVEAEVAGTRGVNVVLAVQGIAAQWPIARLAPPDQAFVHEWQSNHTAVKHVTVQVFERDGVGRKGEFPKAEPNKPASPFPVGLPIGPKTETKVNYKHCDILLNNPAAVDASLVKVDYVLYVISPDGSVGSNAGTQTIPAISAGQGSNLVTEGITASRTKTSTLKLSISNNSLYTSEKTSRSQEQFGGTWVRVSGPDGTLIGEAKKLSPALEKLDPPWVEAAVKEEIPVLKSLSEFKELLQRLLPPRSTEPTKPNLPPLPPGFQSKP